MLTQYTANTTWREQPPLTNVGDTQCSVSELAEMIGLFPASAANYAFEALLDMARDFDHPD